MLVSRSDENFYVIVVAKNEGERYGKFAKRTLISFACNERKKNILYIFWKGEKYNRRQIQHSKFTTELSLSLSSFHVSTISPASGVSPTPTSLLMSLELCANIATLLSLNYFPHNTYLRFSNLSRISMSYVYRVEIEMKYNYICEWVRTKICFSTVNKQHIHNSRHRHQKI